LTELVPIPQGRLAIGMALVATDRFPGNGNPILVLTIAGTILFKLQARC